MMLAIGAIMLAALLYLVTKDFVSGAVVIVAALLLGVYARHEPRQLQYSVDPHGIQVGQKHFSYG
jgi:hypothetical protein